MAKADVGETKRVPVEIQPGGLLVFGPQLAGNGMSLQIDAKNGGVRVALVCADKAAIAAEAFLADRVAAFEPLASGEIRGNGGKLAIKPAHCQVLTIVGPLDDRPATFTLQRPPGEIAQSTGGPLIHCAAKPEPHASSPSEAPLPIRPVFATASSLHPSDLTGRPLSPEGQHAQPGHREMGLPEQVLGRSRIDQLTKLLQ